MCDRIHDRMYDIVLVSKLTCSGEEAVFVGGCDDHGVHHLVTKGSVITRYRVVRGVSCDDMRGWVR